MFSDSVVFLGTAPFALPSLKIILENKFNLAGVLTRPDRPAGRGNKISASPVKEMALEYGQRVFQPINKAELEKELLHIKPGIMISVAYGMILPAAVLEIPPLGAINLHPSLLPAYRGAAPIQRALLAGEDMTGVSVFYMASETDAGDLILQQKASIDPHDTFGTLSHRLALLGAEKVLEALKLIISGDAPRTPQDNTKATFAPPLTKEDELIDWSKGGFSIANQVRALEPAPGAYTYYRGKRLKIWKANPEELSEADARTSNSPGTISRVGQDYIVVSTAENPLKIVELQPEGKKRMRTEDFLKGYLPQVGDQFA